MESEISAGLRNALERGQTIEQATKSLTNAGYNPQEVKAAAASLSSGSVSQIVHPVGPTVPQEKHNLPQLPGNKIEPGLKKKGNKLTILIIVFLLLIVFVGGLVWLISALGGNGT